MINFLGFTISRQTADALFVSAILVGFVSFLVFGTKLEKPTRKH